MKDNITMENNIEQIKAKKNKKKKKWFIVIVLALMILFGVNNYPNKKVEGGNTVSTYIMGDGFSPGLSKEEIMKMLQSEVDASKISFSVYTKPIFKGKNGSIMFGNPQHNLYDIDLEVQTGDRTVIKTNKIPPNKHIKEIGIIGDRLAKGEHKAEGIIKGYDRETGELVGKVIVDMTLVVKQ